MKKNHLIAYFAACLLLLPMMCSAESDQTMIPKMVVKGEATLHIPADQVELTVGVVTKDPDSGKAVQDNNVKMRDMLAKLAGIGLTKDEYQTGTFQVQPSYYYPPHGGEAKLTHYDVTNTIKIKTVKIDLIEKIIGAASEAGSNKIEQIAFGLSNPRAYREEAIQQAAQNALSDAKSLAMASQVQLVRVLNLNLDDAQPHYPVPIAFFGGGMAAKANSFEAPIEIGDVDVRASVNITFEIESVGSFKAAKK